MSEAVVEGNLRAHFCGNCMMKQTYNLSGSKCELGPRTGHREGYG